MEIRSTEEARSNVEEFTTRLLNLLNDKKSIDLDIKALKEEWKEEGVPVSVVTAVINQIKKALKETDDERFEKETMKEWLESSASITEKIETLID